MKSSFYISLFLVLLLSTCVNENNERGEVYFREYSDQDFEIFLNKILQNQQNEDLDFQENIAFNKAYEDLQILKHILEEACTPLYRYSSKSKIDSLFQSFIQNPRDSISYFDFTKNLGLLFSEIGCMHSGWGHSKAYKFQRNSNYKFLPFEFIILDHELFILKNFSPDSTLLEGSKVLQINNQSSDSIIKQIEKFMTSDAHNLVVKEKAVSDYFPMAYSNFIAKPDSFDLEILQGATMETKTISALTKAEINSFKEERQNKSTL